MAGCREAFWGWDRHRWVTVLRYSDPQIRQIVLAVGYLLCAQHDVHLEFRGFKARKFASRVFGAEPVDAAIASVAATSRRAWARSRSSGARTCSTRCWSWMLLAGSPLLEDLAERRRAAARGCARGRSTTRAATASSSSPARSSRWASLTRRRSPGSRRVRTGSRAAAPASSACRSCGWTGSGGGFRPRRSPRRGRQATYFMADQGRPLDRARAPRTRRPARLDAGARRQLGRGRRPAGRRRATRKPRTPPTCAVTPGAS